MAMTAPEVRFAVGEGPDGRKYLVVNLSGEFPTMREVAAFFRESGEYMIEHADRVGDPSHDED